MLPLPPPPRSYTHVFPLTTDDTSEESLPPNKCYLLLFPPAGTQAATYYDQKWIDNLSMQGVTPIGIKLPSTSLGVLSKYYDAVNVNAGNVNAGNDGGSSHAEEADADVYINDLITALYMTSEVFESPYAVYGHSAGGLMAARFTLLVERHAKIPPPIRLFISSAVPPLPNTSSVPGSNNNDNNNDALVAPEFFTDDKVCEDMLKLWMDGVTLDEGGMGMDIKRSMRSDLRCSNSIVNAWRGEQMKTEQMKIKKETEKDGIVSNVVIKANVTIMGATNDPSTPFSELANWYKLTTTTPLNSRPLKSNSSNNNNILDSQHKLQEVKAFTSNLHNYHTHETIMSVASALLSDLKMLSQKAHDQVTVWNNVNKMKYPDTATLHSLFAVQVLKTPNAIAVIDGSSGLKTTYAELDYKSTLLASYLYEKCSVRPGTNVGIFLPRCTEFIICYIAALKAGGAYMPLEIVYPNGLLSKVLESTKSCVVLSFTSFESRIPDWQTSFFMDPGWESMIESMKLTPLPADTGATPDTMAYIVMSSGTTGTPKGICCPHRGAVHSYHYRAITNPTAAGDVEACNVFFVWECFRPLIIGGTTLIVPDEVVYDPLNLVKLLKAFKATRMLFTPSLLSHTMSSLADDVLQRELSGLTYVNLCGEVVSVQLVKKFNRLFPKCVLVNLYSISECHDAAQATLSGENNELYGPTRNPKYSVAGKVIPNVRLHVLNERLEESPIGVFGEVYVGGPVLAIGYLNKPEQTAERFVDNPFRFSTETGPGEERLYRTGDRARFLPDGQLEVAGRVAFFIKIRGYSVVPTAIEATLAEHEHVATAVVVALGDIASFDKKLVAYIVPKTWELLPTQSELRSHCKKFLPPYSIPALFVPLRALPVSKGTSAKLDSKALPDWAKGNEVVEESEKEIALRRGLSTATKDDVNINLTTPHEIAVADVWRRINGIASNDIASVIHPSDTFYDCGGSSLKLAEVAHCLSALSGSEVKIAMIVKDLSLKGVAHVLAVSIEVGKRNVAVVEKAWRVLLSIDDNASINISDSFYDLGGHSLKVAQLSSLLSEDDADFSLEIGVRELISDPTLGGMALAIECARRDNTLTKTRSNSFVINVANANNSDQADASYANFASINLPAEAQLDMTIGSGPARHHKNRIANSTYAPRRVLLTGGTGYLGAFIMFDLAVRKGISTYALVRAATADVAMKRLVDTLKKYNLLKQDDSMTDEGSMSDEMALFLDHVQPVPGDLNYPLFGLQDAAFKQLSGEIDAIVHCAAEVNLFKKYADLKKSNVLGTQEALRLATTRSSFNHSSATANKIFIHISSNGVFPTSYLGPRLEDADLDDESVWGALHDGYGQSKYVAEKMVEEAGERGLPVCIMRPGNMSASSLTGAWNYGDFVALFLKACIELKCAPNDAEMDGLGWELDLTPVDYAADVIGTLIVKKIGGVLGTKVHVQNENEPIPMSAGIGMLRELGFDINERASLKEWQRKLEKAAGKNDKLAACAIAFDSFALYFCTGGEGKGRFSAMNLGRVLRENNGGNEKEGSFGGCPKVDKEYFGKALKWLGVVPDGK